MKYLLYSLSIIFILFGCSNSDDKRLTLVCVGKSTQTDTELVSKKQNQRTIDTTVVYQFENKKYIGVSKKYDCKFTKDEISCDTSDVGDGSFGELKINRVSGLYSDTGHFDQKNLKGESYLRTQIDINGKCEISKENKF